DLKTAPPRPPGAVEVTFDNWEEVYWQELKSALYDPVLDFPDASEAVRKRICALKDEVFAKHNIT
ncbi:MAG: hypothetical protein K2Q23_03425, partial [Bryobacteraceae bacterium]|nr:hypothetical protein [Bryobacteraceae bacterium]